MENIKDLLAKGGRIHFVGIGGSGMFPIVQILHSMGHQISGSDVNEGSIIDLERGMGIEVSIGHDAKNVIGASMLVVSAAIFNDNVEVNKALELNIPIISRADMFGYITTLYENSLCVSGTHGKTTTTCLLSSILIKANMDPSLLIGGKLPLINGYGLVGKSDKFVCEACEFKDTFLHLSPSHSIILNIDNDHLDYFGTLDNIIKSFHKFADNASKKVIANIDDENTVKAVKDFKDKLVSFAINNKADYQAINIINYDKAFYQFDILHNDINIGTFKLHVPGKHHVINGLAACTAALELGCPINALQAGLESFKGAGRRFEFIGSFNEVAVADDYAHHPTEIAATLKAAKAFGYNRVIAVFQPFTYTRTKLLMNDFAESLAIADVVVMSAIMGSREKDTLGISTQNLADLIPGSVWFETFEQMEEHIRKIAKPHDLVITLGCGDIYKLAKKLVA